MIIWWHEVRKRIGLCKIDSKSWDGSDLFLIEGGLQELGVFITSVGLAKMKQLGFQNLELTQADWI